MADRVVKRIGTIGVAFSVAVRLAMMLVKRSPSVVKRLAAEPHSRCTPTQNGPKSTFEAFSFVCASMGAKNHRKQMQWEVRPSPKQVRSRGVP